MADRPIPATPGELAAASSQADAADDVNVAANTQSNDAVSAGALTAEAGQAVPEADPQVGDATQQGAVAQGEEDAAVASQAADPTEASVDPAAQGDADAQAVDAESVEGASDPVVAAEGVEADPTAPIDPAAEDAPDPVADPAAKVDAAEAGADPAQDPAAQADPAAGDASDPNVATQADPAGQAAEAIGGASETAAQADPAVEAADPAAGASDPAAADLPAAGAPFAAASASTDGIASTASSSSRDASASADALANLPDNPIDFAALQEDNEDIYAWLYIPNTSINLPVLQSPFDDAYYLTHDPDRNEDVYGSVFSQLANKKDFTDPVTVLYGHDGEGQFKNLHYFEDEEFFAQNELLYVYTPGHILTYRVVAAYKYDNRHILNSFDFADPVVLQQYYDSVLNPDSLLLNVREGATLDATKDKIIQLSTCMLDEFHGSSRYVVTGVLVDDELTK
ncbi:MAG: sortase [Coriobacteriia bacterium]|nr:sortase [Coriobacteriia bacterium]MBS5477404.1 sortase [Coriobacteriia bacterium]